MLCQSPRLFHAAALRETLHGMSVRLGHVEIAHNTVCSAVCCRTPAHRAAQQPCSGRNRVFSASLTRAGKAHSIFGKPFPIFVFKRHSRPIFSDSIICAGPPGQATLHSGDQTGSANSQHNVKGQIDIIMGPMFAGKTSELLRRVEDLEAILDHPPERGSAEISITVNVAACTCSPALFPWMQYAL